MSGMIQTGNHFGLSPEMTHAGRIAQHDGFQFFQSSVSIQRRIASAVNDGKAALPDLFQSFVSAKLVDHPRSPFHLLWRVTGYVIIQRIKKDDEVINYRAKLRKGEWTGIMVLKKPAKPWFFEGHYVQCFHRVYVSIYH